MHRQLCRLHVWGIMASMSPRYQETCQAYAIMPAACVGQYGINVCSVSRETSSICNMPAPCVGHYGFHVSSVSRGMSSICNYAASMCEVLWHPCLLCVRRHVMHMQVCRLHVWGIMTSMSPLYQEACHAYAIMPPPCVGYYGIHVSSVSRDVNHMHLCRLHVCVVMASMPPLYQDT